MSDADLVASLLAIDPSLGGAVARVGDHSRCHQWIEAVRTRRGGAVPVRRMPLGISDDRLIGGLDLVASLAMRHRVAARGILAETNGGVLVVPLAERASTRIVWEISAALDVGAVAVERDGVTTRDDASLTVIAIASSVSDDDRVPDALRDRLAFDVDVDAFGPTAVTPVALGHVRSRLPNVHHEADAIDALCRTATALAVESLRAPLLALRAARAIAALGDRTIVTQDDLVAAVRLVLIPRARTLPSFDASDSDDTTGGDEPAEDTPAHDRSAESSSQNAGEAATAPVQNDSDSPSSLTDRVVAAARALLSTTVLDGARQLTAGRAHGSGRSAAERVSAQRGRPIGVRRGDPRTGRLDVVATLQTAAPWQRLRRATEQTVSAPRLVVLRDDFRIRRYRQRVTTTTIFAVDASGSAARARMAEAKGAIELLLGASYARRDRVGLIAFSGRTARCVLAPTRALAKARRELAGLAAGGGTPLATGLDAALETARTAQSLGGGALIVLVTDGGANIARNGSAGRPQATADALDAARRIARLGLDAVVVDCAARESQSARAIATAMRARYVWLQRADARAMHAAVRDARHGTP